jgi:hypothetical protein
MKQCLDGNGNDSTAAVATYLLNNPTPLIKTLYLIGNPEDPYALWLTDWESDLEWSLYGTFIHAAVTRGSVTTKIGLESTSLDISYSPALPRTFGSTTATMNPMQLAQLGFYDNWPVYVWNVYLPMADGVIQGDANTLGCSQLFAGIVGSTSVDRTGIKFSVDSLLYVLDQQVPGNVIEMTNVQASFLGTQPAPGQDVVATFEVVAPSSPTQFAAQCLGPDAGHAYSDNTFQGGYVIFTSGVNEGFWSGIGASGQDNIGGTIYNTFTLFSPLQAAPAPGDQFYVSTAFPIDQSETTDFYGFPFVPDPTQAI